MDNLMVLALLTGQAPGAIPNGAGVIKQNSESEDGHPDGTRGVVVSSLRTPNDMRDDGFDPFFYFVDWGEGIPIGTMSSKVKEADSGS